MCAMFSARRTCAGHGKQRRTSGTAPSRKPSSSASFWRPRELHPRCPLRSRLLISGSELGGECRGPLVGAARRRHEIARCRRQSPICWDVSSRATERKAIRTVGRQSGASSQKHPPSLGGEGQATRGHATPPARRDALHKCAPPEVSEVQPVVHRERGQPKPLSPQGPEGSGEWRNRLRIRLMQCAARLRPKARQESHVFLHKLRRRFNLVRRIRPRASSVSGGEQIRMNTPRDNKFGYHGMLSRLPERCTTHRGRSSPLRTHGTKEASRPLAGVPAQATTHVDCGHEAACGRLLEQGWHYQGAQAPKC